MDRILHLSKTQIYFLLVAGIALAFGQVVTFDFVSYDDAFYVRNVHVQKGLTWEGLAWTFSLEKNFAQYLNWISHMIDVELFGFQPAGHHFTSLALHAINTLLFFTILNRLTDERNLSAGAAVLFALHPLRVETVAWVADRKDLLAMLFALLAIEAYRRYVRDGRTLNYALMALCFLLALLSKPVMMVLPGVLFVLDYWPMNRLHPNIEGMAHRRATVGSLVMEKLPLLAISLAFCWMAWHGLSARGIVSDGATLPLLHRIVMVPVLYMKYLANVFWPVQLSMFYPKSTVMPETWLWLGSLAVILGVTFAAWRIRRDHPAVLAGWLWFVGTLLPLVSLVKTGDHEMADRYTYFPLAGLCIALVWAVARSGILERLGRPATATATAAFAGLLMFAAYTQTSIWKNNSTLYRANIAYNAGNFMAQTNLAFLLMGQAQWEPARQHLERAVADCPRCVEAQLNLGFTYARLNRLPEAIATYQRALKLTPGNAIVHAHLGPLYHRLGNGAEAIRQLKKAEALFTETFGPNYRGLPEIRAQLKTYYEVYGDPSEADALSG